MFAFALIPVALLASQVVAVASPSPFSRGTLANVLSARQSLPTIPSSSVPQQCQSDCNAMLSVARSCTTGFDCLCTDATGNAFVQCGNCIVNLPGVTDDLKSLEQSTLNALTSACQSQGRPFNKPLQVSAKGGALSLSPSGAFAVVSAVAGLFALAL